MSEQGCSVQQTLAFRREERGLFEVMLLLKNALDLGGVVDLDGLE